MTGARSILPHPPSLRASAPALATSTHVSSRRRSLPQTPFNGKILFAYLFGFSARGPWFTIPFRMSTALYRKWRSQTFDEVVGQEHITQTLKNALRDGRTSHAYLFTGPRGTGKTSTARIFAKALNCLAPAELRPCDECTRCKAISEGRYVDLIEIDAASNNSVEDVREMRERVGFSPAEGPIKIYIIDEVHMLSQQAFNALLKTLEEPPRHVCFILATTEPQKLPATVLSRCQRFDFRRIPTGEIAAHLRHIVTAEGRAAEDEALTAIARSAQGCMRDAVSLLDQMLSYGDTVTFAQVQESLGAVSAQAVSGFVDAIAHRNVAAGLGVIQGLLVSGASLTEFCHQVVEHLRGVLVAQMTLDAALLSELPAESVAAMMSQARLLQPAATIQAIRRFSAAVPEMKGGFQPQLPLEMALIESVQGVSAGEKPSAAPPPAGPQHAAAPVNPQALQQTVDKAVQQAVQAAMRQMAPAARPASEQSAAAAAAATNSESAPVAESAEEVAITPVDEQAVTRFMARWKQFKDEWRKRDQKINAALNTVRDIAIGGNQVAFAFGNNSFTRDIIAKPENHALVVATLVEYLGTPVTLECQVGDHAYLSAVVSMSGGKGPAGGPDPLLEFAKSELHAEVKRDE